MDGLSDSETHERYLVASKLFARELSVTPGELCLVVNGRVFFSLYRIEAWVDVTIDLDCRPYCTSYFHCGGLYDSGRV